MLLYFTSALDVDRWGARVHTHTISDHYIPLWKKAEIYTLLYESERVTCEQAIPELTQALIHMCVYYLDYRAVVKLAPVNENLDSLMDEMLREQVFRQAVAILAMLIQATSSYPHAVICRKEEAYN